MVQITVIKIFISIVTLYINSLRVTNVNYTFSNHFLYIVKALIMQNMFLLHIIVKSHLLKNIFL